MLTSLIIDQQEMVKHFDGYLDCHSRQQEHHRSELEALKTQSDKHSHNQGEIVSKCEFLKAQLLLMEVQLCRCGKDSPKWKGKGVTSDPLEYELETLGLITVLKGRRLQGAPFVRMLHPSLSPFLNHQDVP